MDQLISPAELIGNFGGSYSKELGIDLSCGDHVEIQKWFLAALLFGARISRKIAAKTYAEFQSAGMVSPENISNAGWNALVRILGRGGYTRYDFKTAYKLLEASNTLLHNYAGDLNTLHSLAADGPDLEQRIKQLGKGIGDATVNIFLRELRGIWPKAQPLLSKQTVQAAKALSIIESNLSDNRHILERLKAAALEDGIMPEDFPDFEAALVRYGFSLQKRT